MGRDKAYASIDFTEVEPLLVRSSGGSQPQAAVAWSELQSAIANFVDEAVMERAIASLFCDAPLVGGVTDQRLVENEQYFYTRFELDLPVLTGIPAWQTTRLTDDGLLDAHGWRHPAYYDFKVVSPGVVAVEFRSASANPVIPDGQFTLIVQRRPTQPALPNQSQLLSNNSSYAFPNGASITINDDWTISPRMANGTAQEQQGVFLPDTVKASATGFMAQLSDGQFVRYTLTNDAVSLPPSISSHGEHWNF